MKKETLHISLRCDTCGSDSHFISNEDNSYIKCSLCNREYWGGREELIELNFSNIQTSFKKTEDEITKLFLKRFKI
jgi:hypothetical protein